MDDVDEDEDGVEVSSALVSVSPEKLSVEDLNEVMAT